MIGQRSKVIFTALLSFSLLTGFGLKDLKKEVLPDKDKCKNEKDRKKCEREENIKSGAKIIAIGVAAKLIYDMVVEYTSIGVKGDHEIIEIYLKKNKALPSEPKVIEYTTDIQPSDVVKTGKQVVVNSALSVVPGKSSRQVKIEEKIEIFDNEDNSKAIKSLVKAVNGADLKGGAFENRFSFTLPEGMPQGIYPIKTAVIVDGKQQESADKKMQLVLMITPQNDYQIAYFWSSN